MSTTKSKSNFWKIFLSIVVLLMIIVGLGTYQMSRPNISIADNSVLTLNISGNLPDAVLDEDFSSLFSRTPLSLQGLRKTLIQARTDERIQMVLINIGPLMTGFAKLEELKYELEMLKQSGKEVWAHLSFAGDKEYYLATSADKIFLDPYSALFLDGLKVELLYFKTPFEKLGIEFEASAQGKYKSAVEALVNNTPSQADLEQRNALLDDFFEHYVSQVSQSRNFSAEKYRKILDSELLIQDKKALDMGLIDEIAYMSEIKNKLNKKYQDLNDEKTIFISARSYAEAEESEFEFGSDHEIAIITIQGDLIDADGDFGKSNSFGTNQIVRGIQKAAKNESVKAILLRIDSPGGSGIASDKILNALDSAKTKKPVVASMSGIAASGGYWVAMNANRIYANSMTVTGSIGVFSIKPYLKKLQENIGLKRVVLKRGKFSDAFNAFDKFPAEAYEKYDAYLANFYDVFINKVASYRNMPVDSVKQVAEGRVWSGLRAKTNGLIDEIGGMSKALEMAENLSDIPPGESYRLVNYPKRKDFFEQLFDREQMKASLNTGLDAIKTKLAESIVKAWLGANPMNIPTTSYQQVHGIIMEGLGLKPLTWQSFEVEVN